MVPVVKSSWLKQVTKNGCAVHEIIFDSYVAQQSYATVKDIVAYRPRHV